MLKVRCLEINPPRKTKHVANAKVEFSNDSGSTIIVDDFRIVRNRNGQLWVAHPACMVIENGAPQYFPTVVFSNDVRHRIEECVLAACEASPLSQVVRR